MKKKRIALIPVGGLGGGFAQEAVPALSAITRALADRFDISVYSLIAPAPGFVPEKYTMHSPPESLGHGPTRKLRWSWLRTQFLREHGRRRYDTLFSIWGYPMGVFVVALAKLVQRPSISPF